MADSTDAVRARLRSSCPFFVADQAHEWKSVKAVVFTGDVEGTSAIAKVLHSPLPVWWWYLHREVALYRTFSAHPLPVRTPRLLSADVERGVLILERIAGRSLSVQRRGTHALRPQIVHELITATTALRTMDPQALSLSTEPPARQIVATMRDRMLEDPCSHGEWFRHGITRGISLGIITATDGARMQHALDAWPHLAFNHGDLLLRNTMECDNHLVLIDWECAGMHPAMWDAAQLWASLPDVHRPALEASVRERSEDQTRAFWASVAFALVREIKFRSRDRRTDPRSESMRRRDELSTALSKL